MKTIKVKAMMEGAILAALTAILGLFYNVPVVNVLTMFWAVPIIIVGYRNGFKVSIIAAFVAAMLASLIVTPVVGVILFVTYAIPGAVMGYMMRKQYNPFVTIAVCGLILSITAVLEFILSMELVLGISLTNIIFNFSTVMNSFYSQLYEQAAQAVHIYRSLGFDETVINEAMELMKEVIEQVKLLLPFGFLTTGIMAGFLNFKAVLLVLRRMGYKLKDVKRFSEWSLKRRHRFILLGITFAMLLLSSAKLGFLETFSLNIWLILQLIYFILGLSVAAYFIQRLGVKYEIPNSVQGLLVVLSLFIFASILPYVGLFDLAADIRRFDSNIRGGVQ